MKKATQPPVVASKTAPQKVKTFDASKYVTTNISLDRVNEVKVAFDLFDTDQGGTINMSCM
jgi:hypothetical protein